MGLNFLQSVAFFASEARSPDESDPAIVAELSAQLEEVVAYLGELREKKPKLFHRPEWVEEEKFGTIFWEWNEPKLVEYQEVEFGERSFHSAEFVILSSFDELVNQSWCGDEADLLSCATGRDTQANGQMGLTNTTGANEKNILLFLDIAVVG